MDYNTFNNPRLCNLATRPISKELLDKLGKPDLTTGAVCVYPNRSVIRAGTRTCSGTWYIGTWFVIQRYFIQGYEVRSST